ncbi:MAG: lysylphosphatidylglycerol synthase transmembrane domain-containing protein [Deltaproteobacteria bacterium]|nr:lysylphosphatidylglycerol synthase transmembrane domain-containing protein [Deltaproteobacteria bacterium]
MSSSITRRRVVQLLVSIVIGVVCLWLAFRGLQGGSDQGDVSVDDVQRLIGTVPASTYVVYAGLLVLQFVVRTERWRGQVKGLTGVAPGWRDALAINAFAFAAVFLLPFRLGEFVRPNLCARRNIMPASAGLAASALERIIDGLVTTAMFGALLLLAPQDLPPMVRVGGLTALGIFSGAAVFFVVAFRFRSAALALVQRVAGGVNQKLANKLEELIGGFLDGLACFRGPRDVVAYLGLSVVYWAVAGFSMLVIVRGVDPSASLLAGLFCLCFLVIGVMIPAPPGNVGNFHAFARLGLTVSGVAAGPAVASAVLLHALNIVGIVLWAALFAVVGGISLRGASSDVNEPPKPL